MSIKSIILGFIILLFSNNINSQGIDSLIKLLPKIKNDSVRATIMLDIANNLYFIDTLKADNYVLTARLIGEKINSPQIILNSFRLSAKIFDEKCMWDSTILYYKKALVIAEKENLIKIKALILNEIGMSYHERDYFEKAFEYYHKFLSISEELNDDALMLKAFNNIGLILYNERRFDLALKYYKEGLDKGKKIGDIQGIAIVSANISQIYEQKGKLDSSFLYINLSIKLLKKTNDFIRLNLAYNNLSSYFEKVNMPDSALKYYLITINNNEELVNKSYKADPLLKIADLFYYKYNNHEQAEKYYLEAEKFASASETPKSLEEIYNRLAILYKYKKKYKLSAEYFYKMMKLNDSISRIEINKKIAEIQTKYEISKKEHKIKLQEKENKLQNVKIEEQKKTTFIIILIFSFIFISVFAYIIYRWQKYKQRLLELQIETQDYTKKEISSELHSGIGSELTAVILHLENKLGKTKETERIKSIYQHIRTASHILALPDFLLTTIDEEINDLVDGFQTKNLNIEASIYSKTNWKDVSPIIQQNIYRIVQELFSNTMKYAQANNIEIQLVHHETYINLIYEDNGKGYNPEKIIQNKGYKNEILARTKVLKGTFVDDSKIGLGTFFNFKFPV